MKKNWLVGVVFVASISSAFADAPCEKEIKPWLEQKLKSQIESDISAKTGPSAVGLRIQTESTAYFQKPGTSEFILQGHVFWMSYVEKPTYWSFRETVRILNSQTCELAWMSAQSSLRSATGIADREFNLWQALWENRDHWVSSFLSTSSYLIQQLDTQSGDTRDSLSNFLVATQPSRYLVFKLIAEGNQWQKLFNLDSKFFSNLSSRFSSAYQRFTTPSFGAILEERPWIAAQLTEELSTKDRFYKFATRLEQVIQDSQNIPQATKSRILNQLRTHQNLTPNTMLSIYQAIRSWSELPLVTLVQVASDLDDLALIPILAQDAPPSLPSQELGEFIDTTSLSKAFNQRLNKRRARIFEIILNNSVNFALHHSSVTGIKDSRLLFAALNSHIQLHGIQAGALSSANRGEFSDSPFILSLIQMGTTVRELQIMAKAMESTELQILVAEVAEEDISLDPALKRVFDSIRPPAGIPSAALASNTALPSVTPKAEISNPFDHASPEQTKALLNQIRLADLLGQNTKILTQVVEAIHYPHDFFRLVECTATYLENNNKKEISPDQNFIHRIQSELPYSMVTKLLNYLRTVDASAGDLVGILNQCDLNLTAETVETEAKNYPSLIRKPINTGSLVYKRHLTLAQFHQNQPMMREFLVDELSENAIYSHDLLSAANWVIANIPSQKGNNAMISSLFSFQKLDERMKTRKSIEVLEQNRVQVLDLLAGLKEMKLHYIVNKIEENLVNS